MIGRDEETKMLGNLLRDDSSHFVAIYGRRRVGKTFLVREVYRDRFTFQHAGLSDGTMHDQLQAFEGSLKEAGFIANAPLGSWMGAFEALKDLIRASNEKKKVIFIDELSWMDTRNSRLIVALEQFWNGWASARNDIILIVCASATSWMLSNIIHNKGGLYNRLTEQIPLAPFSLKTCEEYVYSMGISLTRMQVLQYYMIFGGVPYYWTFLKKGYSLAQNIDMTLFGVNAPLKEEFAYLYSSIFKNPEPYLKIIKALSGKKSGLTRDDVISSAKIANSGDLSRRLEELESCGFVRSYLPHGKKKKNTIYQLVDFFTLFYYNFMINKPTDERFWSNQINTPAVNTWYGLAFERVCLMHINKIKEKLGISGVHTDVHSLYCKSDPDSGVFGSQIDLLIARADGIINLCEMKYSESEYTFTSKDDKDIKRKIHDLQVTTKTKSAIHPTLITTHGIVENAYSSELQVVITMEDLF